MFATAFGQNQPAEHGFANCDTEPAARLYPADPGVHADVEAPPVEYEPTGHKLTVPLDWPARQ